MKFSILQQDLLPLLSSVSRSVGIRSTLPVLSNILLATKDSKLKIAATNLEIGVIKFTKVEVLKDGEITIPAKTLLEVIQGLGPVKISFDAQKEVLNISASSFRASINGISASEFPTIPILEGKGINFKKEVLEGCSEILFAASSDEGRPTLTGILTQVLQGRIDFVATDGFRLAHRQVNLTDFSKEEFKTLIPKKTFEEIIKILAEDEADQIETQTSAGQNQIIFKVGQTTVSSRLIEGQFPNWEKIIPTKITTKAIIDRLNFLQAVKLASVFTRTDNNILTLKITQQGLSLSSEAKELGSQENNIGAQIEGDDLKIAFNTKFLIDILSATSANQMGIEFSGPLSATLIKPVGIDGLEYIIMPVRLS